MDLREKQQYHVVLMPTGQEGWIGVWDDGQARPCMGRCMGVCMSWCMAWCMGGGGGGVMMWWGWENAWVYLPVVSDPNPTPPNLQALGLHDTAAEV